MDTQQGITLLIVAVAALFLARRLWRDWRGQGGGSSCAGCAGACGKPAQKNPNVRAAPEAKPLITLSAGAPARRPFPPPHQQ